MEQEHSDSHVKNGYDTDFPGDVSHRIGGLRYSPQFGKITACLLKAQMNIKTALKDSNNPHFKSKYADLSSVFEACKEALNFSGIVIVQAPESTKSEVSVTTTLFAEGEWIACRLTAPLTKHDAQSVGSAVTYLRRYSLSSLVGVVSDDDDGNAATAAATQTQPTGSIEAPKTGAASSEVIKQRLAKYESTVATSGEWVIPFGRLKDKRVSEISNDEVIGLIKYYSNRPVDAKYQKENEHAVAVLNSEAKTRGLLK